MRWVVALRRLLRGGVSHLRHDRGPGDAVASSAAATSGIADGRDGSAETLEAVSENQYRCHVADLCRVPAIRHSGHYHASALYVLRARGSGRGPGEEGSTAAIARTGVSIMADGDYCFSATVADSGRDQLFDRPVKHWCEANSHARCSRTGNLSATQQPREHRCDPAGINRVGVALFEDASTGW